MAGARGRAPHGRIAVRPLCVNHSVLQGMREKGGEGSAWLARVGAPRTAESPCNPYMILSLPSTCAELSALNGRPLHSVHALLPPFSSLFPTFPLSAEPFVPVQESLDFFAEPFHDSIECWCEDDTDDSREEHA